MKNSEKITIRMSSDMREKISVHVQNSNYQHESDFIRDCINNGLDSNPHFLNNDRKLDLQMAIYHIDTALTMINVYIPTIYGNAVIPNLTESRNQLWKLCQQGC